MLSAGKGKHLDTTLLGWEVEKKWNPCLKAVDGTTKDVRGLTPAEVAKEKGRVDLYEILSRQDPKGLWR
jgi:hypothetical protein